jgi:hypothetical protein
MAGYGGTILAVQDTTGVNCNTPVKTEGIGHSSDRTLGVNVHSRLAATRDRPVSGVWTSQVITGKNRKPNRPAMRAGKYGR